MPSLLLSLNTHNAQTTLLPEQIPAASIVIFSAAGVGLVWALIQFAIISRIKIKSISSDYDDTQVADAQDAGETDVNDINDTADGLADPLLAATNSEQDETTARLLEIYSAIYEGADSFLRAEYRVCFWFVSAFSVLILILVSWGTGWDFARGGLTATSFLLGALTSMASGYLGMKVATYSNVRTTISAQKNGWTACFNTAFRAGAVMGFSLCGLGILMLYSTMLVFRLYYPKPEDWLYLTECLTGFGLGGSVIAMFGRVGGGIYTKGESICCCVLFALLCAYL